jgi:hypothetical protein
MPRIFISYRRSASSGHAGRLYDRLIVEYGADNVFLDVEGIPPGETFSSYLLAKIDASDICLLMLGQGTLDRVTEEDDWVRREIAYALQQPNITLIPVLQDGSLMPAPDTLPDDIRDITSKNALFLFHQMFDESVAKIINSINSLLTSTPQTPSEIPIRHDDTPNTSTSSLGQIKIHRAGNMVAYRIRPFTIKIDGQDVYKIANNETITLDAPTGQHILSVHVDYHHAQQVITIGQGELQSFEIQVRNMGLSVTLERI